MFGRSVLIAFLSLLYSNWAPFAAAGLKDMKLVVWQLECRGLSAKVKTINCFSSIRQQLSYITVGAELADDLDNLTLEVTMSMMQPDRPMRTLYTLKLDLCRSLQGNARRSILGMVYEQIEKAMSNLPKKCPLKKGRTYGFRDYQMSTERLPIFLPSLNFTTVGCLFSGKEKISNFKTVASLCSVRRDCKPFMEAQP